MASSFLNAAGTIGRVTINERIEAGRRERRVLTRVSRAAAGAGRTGRTWALKWKILATRTSSAISGVPIQTGGLSALAIAGRVPVAGSVCCLARHGVTATISGGPGNTSSRPPQGLDELAADLAFEITCRSNLVPARPGRYERKTKRSGGRYKTRKPGETARLTPLTKIVFWLMPIPP
jgi:hypothetical protein